MKSFIRVLSVSVIGMSMVVGVAAADTTCNGSISNTGPDSTNIVTCTVTDTSSFSCENNILVDNSSDQSAQSGNAFTVTNTTGGGANSGPVSNDNSFTLVAGLDCAPVSPPATTPTPTPSTPAPASSGQVLGATAAPQVVLKPVGAVHAGGGAGVSGNSMQIAGLVGSLTAVVAGAGVLIRKRALGL